MRRALIATAGTVAGLVLLLGYKSGSPPKGQKVSVGSSGGAAATTTTSPPSGSGPTSAPTTVPTASGTPGEREYTGQLVDYIYGDIQVAATLKGGRIVNVTVPRNDATDPHSQMIDSEVVPVLEQEALSAQGVNFDVVSGATYTSNAFAQSLQTALDQVPK
ncbi:MAG TPA: FMN-binding protein [Acidimicrobiales bacterium]|nr:FMN-binding protein [Acidimicrobiales bacterium]